MRARSQHSSHLCHSMLGQESFFSSIFGMVNQSTMQSVLHPFQTILTSFNKSVCNVKLMHCHSTCFCQYAHLSHFCGSVIRQSLLGLFAFWLLCRYKRPVSTAHCFHRHHCFWLIGVSRHQQRRLRCQMTILTQELIPRLRQAPPSLMCFVRIGRPWPLVVKSDDSFDNATRRLSYLLHHIILPEKLPCHVREQIMH